MNDTAKQFVDRLSSTKSKADFEKNHSYFKVNTADNKILGVRFASIFKLAKEFKDTNLKEVEKLLDNPFYEVRMGAVSIMDFQARDKKITEPQKKALYDLYIGRHDRINNWDLVDRSAPYVVGGYLNNKPRKILYKLAKSKNLWERRTAIVSTCYFIRQGETDDTFKIAELLVNDKEDLVHKGTGWMLRFAGTKNPKQLISFLDKYAATMPRTLLRYAIEHFDKKKKEYYMGLKKAG